MEGVEEILHTLEIKEKYQKRQKTIERIFADRKENHRMKNTQYRGLTKVKIEVTL